MIFVTVGTDLPFNRLVRTVDAWASENMRTDVFAQIGRTDWVPPYLPHAAFLTPPEFHKQFSQASIIIAHAGMDEPCGSLGWRKLGDALAQRLGCLRRLSHESKRP